MPARFLNDPLHDGNPIQPNKGDFIRLSVCHLIEKTQYTD
jgi:hypothetical protein